MSFQCDCGDAVLDIRIRYQWRDRLHEWLQATLQNCNFGVMLETGTGRYGIGHGSGEGMRRRGGKARERLYICIQEDSG